MYNVVGTPPVGAAPTTYIFILDFNNRLKSIGQRQLQDEMRIIWVLWFATSYTRDFTVYDVWYTTAVADGLLPTGTLTHLS